MTEYLIDSYDSRGTIKPSNVIAFVFISSQTQIHFTNYSQVCILQWNPSWYWSK